MLRPPSPPFRVPRLPLGQLHLPPAGAVRHDGHVQLRGAAVVRRGLPPPPALATTGLLRESNPESIGSSCTPRYPGTYVHPHILALFFFLVSFFCDVMLSDFCFCYVIFFETVFNQIIDCSNDFSHSSQLLILISNLQNLLLEWFAY